MYLLPERMLLPILGIHIRRDQTINISDRHSRQRDAVRRRLATRDGITVMADQDTVVITPSDRSIDRPARPADMTVSCAFGSGSRRVHPGQE